jgi:hypothetical protein
MKNPVHLLLPNIPGSWTPLTTTNIPSSVLIQFGILFWLITVAPTLISTMYAYTPISLSWYATANVLT